MFKPFPGGSNPNMATHTQRTSMLGLVVLALLSFIGTPVFGQIKTKSMRGLPSGGGLFDKPYTFTASFEGEDGALKGKVKVHVKLAPGYHIYSTTQPSGGPLPTVISIAGSFAKPLGPFVSTSDPDVSFEIPTFEGIQVEQFENEVTWIAPISFSKPLDGSQRELILHINGQVCERACIPIRDEEVVAELELLAPPSSNVVERASGPFREQDSVVAWDITLSRTQVKPGDTLELVLKATPDKLHYIYKFDPADNATAKRTLIALTQKAGLKARKPIVDKPVNRKDLGVAGIIEHYEGPVTIRIPLEVPLSAKSGEVPIEGLVGYQGCSMDSCDQPRGLKFSSTYTVAETSNATSQTEVAVSPVPFATVSKHPNLARWIDAPKYAFTMNATELITKFALAMLAGFILNFMPCVLPVIGLKILGFVNEAHGSKSKTAMLTFTYAFGMIAFVLAFGIVSLIVRSVTNETIGWGQQYQSTGFRIAVTAFMFSLALSFLGVWEFPIPGFASSSTTSELSSRQGFFGAFIKGVITTLLATPCSGPFLGSALAVSLSQPAWVVLLIFFGVGVGMALPYLVMAAYPGALRLIPKPGPWMETFKEFLAFPMLLSVVAFVAGFPKVERIAMLSALIFVWFACWLIGRVPHWAEATKLRATWFSAAVVALAGSWGSFYFLGPSPYELKWEPFSEQRLRDLVSDGKTVIVDFTAEWCQNCKLNLALAIQTQKVQSWVHDNDIVPLVADMTENRPDLSAKLRELDSISIPVLAIYPAGDYENPIVLKDILSEREVLQALKEAGPSAKGKNSSLPTSTGSTSTSDIR